MNEQFEKWYAEAGWEAEGMKSQAEAAWNAALASSAGEGMPKLDVTEQDHRQGYMLLAVPEPYAIRISAWTRLACRERQLREAYAEIRSLRAQVEQKGEQISFRTEHDEAARISCTTLDRLTKPYDDMSDEELVDALEYAAGCGCSFCFLNGYIFRLRAALSTATQDGICIRSALQNLMTACSKAQEWGEDTRIGAALDDAERALLPEEESAS